MTGWATCEDTRQPQHTRWQLLAMPRKSTVLASERVKDSLFWNQIWVAMTGAHRFRVPLNCTFQRGNGSVRFCSNKNKEITNLNPSQIHRWDCEDGVGWVGEWAGLQHSRKLSAPRLTGLMCMLDGVLRFGAGRRQGCQATHRGGSWLDGKAWNTWLPISNTPIVPQSLTFKSVHQPS